MKYAAQAALTQGAYTLTTVNGAPKMSKSTMSVRPSAPTYRGAISDTLACGLMQIATSQGVLVPCLHKLQPLQFGHSPWEPSCAHSVPSSLLP